MTREEAIRIIENTFQDAYVNKYYDSVTHQALNMAIEALHREEAEEKGWCHRIRPKNVEVVVRCKDCKHNVLTKDGEYNPEDIVCDYWATDGLEETDYCSYGERKEESEVEE